jgi:hypothetical protein
MNFIDAISYINNTNIRPNRPTYITRKSWPFRLYFCANSQYLMIESKETLTPYVISTFDFDYDWEIDYS